MKLNDELIRIQNGEQGEGMRKILETQITYGEALWVRKGDGENHRAGRTWHNYILLLAGCEGQCPKCPKAFSSSKTLHLW